jgi:hypothetical protein
MDICKVYQIYYDNASKEACFNEYDHIYNTVCTPFFENDIIVSLINNNAHKESKYFGVFSGHFKNKIQGAKDGKRINPDYINNNLDTDVVSFFRSHRNKNVVSKAEQFHPGFTRALENIFERINFKIDLKKDTRFIVYQNHFVAKSDIYERYVKELLEPVMNEMKNESNKELQNIIWQDSGYHKKKTMPEKLKKEMGVPYYPYHTFLCERLFSIFLNKYSTITCKHL